MCSGGILGAGVGRKLAEVRWGTAGRMGVAWCVILPAAATVGALAASAVVHGGTTGTILIGLCAVAAAGGIVMLSRRNPVHADNVNDSPSVAVRAAATAA
ncbi:hypothetical protein HEP84_49555 [Streptomyces sp. RLB1-33]|nr:hypothetical protein [Streptomyces sp. RLB1-33]QIY75845.1 hypothetical protein HEP84_49555 [Streptomyces sp. RLB1-33]